MKSLKLAFINIKKNFENAKELRSAFIMSIIGMCINNVAFIILWYYFGKTVGIINGWKPLDIFGLYGFSSISYGIIQSFFNGVSKIPSYISSGNFDKYLITPKNTLLKVATSSISTSALGDMIFGFICLIIFVVFSNLGMKQIFLLILLIFLASIIFFSFLLLCMSLSFYFMDGEDISSGFFDTFLSVSLYHGGAFAGILRFVFIFIIPSLLLGAVPVEIVKNIATINLPVMLLLTAFWLFFSVLFFYKSLRKYESNNFFGFSG